MKKYIFMLLFFLGCFFACLSTEVNLVEAVTAKVTTDSYDSRKITIALDDVDAGLNRIIINEVRLCQAGDMNCQEVIYRNGSNIEKKQVIFLYSQEFIRIAEDRTATLTYNIRSEGDGLKYFYIATYADQSLNTNYSYFLEHSLSTLSERITVNPDGNGNPMHEYDAVQYTSVRKINFDIKLLESELEGEGATYSGLVYVCEFAEEKLSRCGEYLVGSDTLEYYISSYGDGQKLIEFFVGYKDTTYDLSVPDVSTVLTKDTAKQVSKKLYLDTVGPEISIEGGNWVYVEAGKKYTAQKATCTDAIFNEDVCSVTNDLNVVSIRYDTEDYQIVTYEASDRIGNVSSVSVKIKVEIPQKGNNTGVYIAISVGVLLVTFLILGWVLIKNNEKKKKMSYI